MEVWDIGATQKHPTFCREGVRTLTVVQVTVERGGVKDLRTTGSGILGTGSSGGAVFYRALPLPPPSAFQVLPEEHSGSDASGARDPGWAESGAAIQELAGSRWRRAASEGSLLPTGRADPAPSRAGGAARERESTSVQTQELGEGRGAMLKVGQERIWRCDLEIGWEEQRVTWGRIMWRSYIRF